MTNGGGAQTDSSERWGDYSYLSIDPADNISFWHVNEYYPVTASASWFTRVGKFAFEGGQLPRHRPPRRQQQQQQLQLLRRLPQHRRQRQLQPQSRLPCRYLGRLQSLARPLGGPFRLDPEA
jgi:hypothetical protein